MLADREDSLPEISQPMKRIRRISERPRRFKLNGMALMSLVAFVILGLGLTFVGQRVHVMNLGYELAALEKKLDEATREQEFLMLGMTQARSLERVEQFATTELGMTRPNDHQYIVLDRQTSETSTFLAHENDEPRGILNAAIAWVTRHWPRVQTAEAGRVGS